MYMYKHSWERAYMHMYVCMHVQKTERERERERGGENMKEKTKENAILFTSSRGLQESEIDVNIRSLLNKTRETKSHRKTSV